MSFFVFFCHVIIGLGHFVPKWPPFSHGADHRRSFVQIASTHHLNGGITNDDHQLERVFYWYKTDEYIEVTDEVAEELRADKRYEVTHHRRMKRNKANYSLDADDGIEYAACEFQPSPEVALDLMEQYRRLCAQPFAPGSGAADRRALPVGLVDPGDRFGRRCELPGGANLH